MTSDTTANITVGASASSILTVQDLSFSYKAAASPVFSDVSFSLDPGQVFCIVGPNGCGKSTLEHCVLTHLKPQKGTITVEGKSVFDCAPKELAEKIAYIPQNHTRSFPYRALDIVAMGYTRKNGMFDPPSKNDDDARAVMKQLGIAHLAEIEYTTLSGGELQMVLIARALAQDSKILVLDEPVAHLDIQKSQTILVFLAKLAKKQGKSILISTHDFNHPLFFQDEEVNVVMAIMHKHRMSRVGTPLELLASPLPQETFGIQSTIIEALTNEGTRHYFASWPAQETQL